MKKSLIHSFFVFSIAAASLNTASANIYTWVGQGNNFTGDFWGDESVSKTDWKNDNTTNILKFDSIGESTKQKVFISFGGFSLAGVITDADAGGYTIYAKTDGEKDFTATFTGATQSDVDADSDLQLGLSNFIIESDFTFGTDGSEYGETFSEITYSVGVNVALSNKATFSMTTDKLTTDKLTTGGNTVTVSGSGTYDLNVLSEGGMDTDSKWVVQGDATLLLQNNAGTILTTTATINGSVTLDGGTVSLASGSVIEQTLNVTSNGGGLAVYPTDADASSTLTLNGTISASSLNDIMLNLDGVNLILGG
ncbi:MAG: hypothetical protein R3Y56_09960 [Akkermansia sp.]